MTQNLDIDDISTSRVSILTPCYNSAPHIPRFLNSLLAQTYKNLEIILVNDGSTDKTAEVIKKYVPRLEQEGYKVIFLEQENGGQSSAINNGLKYVTGEFLTWPDSDDWITPDSIEKRVCFLLEHPDVGMVRSNIERIDEESGNAAGCFENGLAGPAPIEGLYEKLALTRTWFAPVGYMVRTSMFDSVLPDREIYVSKRAGQNWQMLLPIAQKFPCWQMSEVLGYYLVRKASHSHSQNSLEECLQYNKMCEDVEVNTLMRIGNQESMIQKVRDSYIIKNFETAARYASISKKYPHFKKAYPYANSLSRKCDMWMRLICTDRIYRIIKKIIRRIKNGI